MNQVTIPEINWLVVGGAPRSGTTALGAALNESADVALFHEYSSKVLFDALTMLFSEEVRMRGQADFDRYEHLMPIRSRDEKAVSQAVFRAVFGKDARFIGTKFPGHHAWPQPSYPAWLGFKEIHVTRNPFDVVLSTLKKDHPVGASQADVENALYWWIHAWNHAVSRADAADFLNVFYDSLVVDHDGWHRKIVDFLGGLDDFSLSAFRGTSEVAASERYAQANLSAYVPMIECIARPDSWLADATAAYAAKRKIGFPLCEGQNIDLCSGANGWRYIDSGFYLAEHDGAWTRGAHASVLFTPEREYIGPASLSVDIAWVAEHHGRGREIEISLDGSTVFRSVVALGSRNGSGMTLGIFVPEVTFKPRSTVSLQLQVFDPLNPHREGLGDDNRDLGIMVRKISVSKLGMH